MGLIDRERILPSPAETVKASRIQQGVDASRVPIDGASILGLRPLRQTHPLKDTCPLNERLDSSRLDRCQALPESEDVVGSAPLAREERRQAPQGFDVVGLNFQYRSEQV